MLRFAVVALLAAVSAVGVAQVSKVFDARRAAQPQAAMMVAEPAATPAVAYGQAASLTKARDGHFWAEAMVDGKPIHVLVDTGATTVALTPEDARRLGHSPATLDYRYEVRTASGPARAAAVKLASVSVGAARVYDVDALVIEKGLDASLLGMTYLSRLSSTEMRGASLILRP